MKSYAFFIGCNVNARVRQYESSTRAVCDKIGVELKDSSEFACCGYPLRNMDRQAFLTAAALNMAVAEKMGVDMLVICKCGFGTLKAAQHILDQDEDARREVNKTLAASGYRYGGGVAVKHLLSVLYHDVGLDALKKHVTGQLKGMKVAAHYGCHALRPSSVTQFDDPVAPSIFERLVEITGAKSVTWDPKTDCCGAPLLGIDDDLSMALARKKLERAANAGVDYLCTACPYCQMQFDSVQHMMLAKSNGLSPLPSVLFPQLLGLSMGLGEKDLHFELNKIEVGDIASFISSEQQNG